MDRAECVLAFTYLTRYYPAPAQQEALWIRHISYLPNGCFVVPSGRATENRNERIYYWNEVDPGAPYHDAQNICHERGR